MHLEKYFMNKCAHFLIFTFSDLPYFQRGVLQLEKLKKSALLFTFGYHDSTNEVQLTHVYTIDYLKCNSTEYRREHYLQLTSQLCCVCKLSFSYLFQSLHC